MEDQDFINQLTEKLSKLGTVRPLGFHYLHPYRTAPADSIICNGATYSIDLYRDFFYYIIAQGWVKTEAEWQDIAARNNGFCPFYSLGDYKTYFRTPKFAPYQQLAMSGAFSIEKTSDNYDYGLSRSVQRESHEWVMCVVAYGVATNVGSVDIQNVMSAVNAVQANLEKTVKSVNGQKPDNAGNVNIEIQRALPNYASFILIATGDFTPSENGWLRLVNMNEGDYTGGKVVHKASGALLFEFFQNRYPGSATGILPVLAGETYVISTPHAVYFHPMR